MDQPPQPQVDLLYPLASWEWREHCKAPVGVYNAQAVVLGSKVYVGGGSMDPGSSSRLLTYDFTKDSWEIVDTPTLWYALSTYHSQLVLVGGMDPDTEIATDQLWVLDEKHQWIQTHISMMTKRCQASAVSVGDHLVVAGGCGGSEFDPLDSVEMYDGCRWRKIQSLPRACSGMKSTLHERNWYLAGGVEQDSRVYYTSLVSLIGTAHSNVTPVWRELPGTPLESSTPAVLRNQLISVGEGHPYNSAIHAYSPNNNCWVHVGSLPAAFYSTCTVVLPAGELLVVGGDIQSGSSSCLFRANIRVTSFPDGRFDMSALDRLEEVAGIPIFNKLAPKFPIMVLVLDFHESLSDSLRMENNPVEGLKAMFKAWLLEKSSLPPTWQVLLTIFRNIQMGDLAEEIWHFFKRTPAILPSPSVMPSGKQGFEVDISDIERKEQQTKADCKDVAVQNSPDSRDVEVQSSPDCQVVAVQTCGEATVVEITSFIRGVEMIAVVKFRIPHQGGSFEWKDYGLKLHVHKGSFPAGMEECKIGMSLSGQFQLPRDSDLLSPVFWLSAPCKFTLPVTLEIQHCALREDEATLSNLSIISARCSQKDLPYIFREVDGGVFTTKSSYGCIQLSHFSGFAVTGRKSTPRLYCAHLYYTMKQMHDWRYYFVIAQDLEAKNTFVREHYGHFANQEATLRVRFERSKITLDIPENGLVTREGWRITPRSHPTISRKDADQFEPGQWIPECQLIVQWEREDRRPINLMHKVHLIGAKPPHDFIYLTLNPKGEEVASRTSPSSGGSPQIQPAMKDLMDAFYHTMADKWEHIGIYLHLPMAALKAINAEHHHDPHKCLIGMLEVWLNRVDPPPTWPAIIETVEFLGKEQLGNELRKKYTGHEN